MIPTKYAELLNLPPEIDPGEARRHCLQLQTELREQSRASLPDSPDLPRLEERLGELEQFLNVVGVDEEIPTEAPTAPKSDLVSSLTLSEEVRAILDIGEDATAEEALAKAEARLKETIDAQGVLKPKHPAHPKLRRDRQRFEGMVANLRETVLTRNIQSLCDLAHEALDAQPSDKVKARECLERGCAEAAQLPPESPCVKQLQLLEARLEEPDAAPEPSPVPDEVEAHISEPSTPTPTLPSANPFLRLEALIDEGMACLVQDRPDIGAARECFSNAALEAAGKGVPANLRNRMHLFKRTLEQVRREAALLQVDEALKQSAAAMAQTPPAIFEARERLGVAESLLKEAPDAFFKSEVARILRAIEEHEQWLALRKIGQHLLADTRTTDALAQPEQNPGLRQPSSSAPSPSPKKISPKPAPVPRIATPRVVSPNPPSIPENDQPAAFVPIAPIKRSRALEVGLALVFIGLIAAVCAGMRIIKAMSALTGRLGNVPVLQPGSSTEKIASQSANQPKSAASQADLGEVSVTVSPPEAILFTNGVSLGRASYPVFLSAPTGTEITLKAELPGYSNATKIVTFPTSQFSDDETLELQPKPALLIVHSDPPATEVLLRKEHSDPLAFARSDDGVEFTPGVPFEMTLQVPDYDLVRTNLSALKPGERKMVDFGKLKLQTATMHLNAYPPDTQFSIVYLGREPIPYGPKTNLEGIIPRVAFELIAEHPGYAPMSNSFLLKPREAVDYDFGKLKPLSASLFVTATPAAFDLKVAWDGASKDYGSEGRAAGLPSGKNLLVTVSAVGHDPASTNLVLEPGEQKQLFFSGLQPAKSYLLLKSDPPGARVTYSIDDHFPIDAGVTDHIDDLPLGHVVAVTLHKTGYRDQFMKRTLLVAGDTLDFGHLLPSPITNITAKVATNAAANVGRNLATNVVTSLAANFAKNLAANAPTNVPSSVATNFAANAATNVATNVITNLATHLAPSVATSFAATPVPAEKERPPSKPRNQYSAASIDKLLKEIDAHIVVISQNVPLTDTSRREWNEWIDKVTAMHRDDSVVWIRLGAPLSRLREVVNRTSPFAAAPFAKVSQ